MLYLGQECVFFVSNGPEMDPRGRGGSGTLSGQWPKGNISPGCRTKSDTNQAWSGAVSWSGVCLLCKQWSRDGPSGPAHSFV